MKLPITEYTSRAWRIQEFTGDFRVEDVWALPIAGERDDFAELVQQLLTVDLAKSSSCAVRGLVAIRLKLGQVLDWDAAGETEATTLRDQLPADLRTSEMPTVPDDSAVPITTLYLIDGECAAEIINRTVHGIIHLGWVPDEAGRYRGQMTILVKPHGLLGAAYMKAIRPFRYLIVYPQLLREIERAWRERDRAERGP
jgi:hypothetical protein